MDQVRFNSQNMKGKKSLHYTDDKIKHYLKLGECLIYLTPKQVLTLYSYINKANKKSLLDYVHIRLRKVNHELFY